MGDLITIEKDNLPVSKTIEITPRDLQDHWFEYAQHGIDLTHQNEVQIVPSLSVGVHYFPAYERLICYFSDDNNIRVGPEFLRASKPLKRALLRHEGSHANFVTIGTVGQAEIVSAFWDHHHDGLSKFYNAMRMFPTYNYKYFDPNVWSQFLDRSRQIGRGYQAVRSELLWNGDSLDPVNLYILIDELIAYGLENRSNTEYLLNPGDWGHPALDVAREVMSKLAPGVQNILDYHGFLNIDGGILLEQLEADPSYYAAQIEISS